MMDIHVHEEKRLFLLSTATASYGMEVTEANALVNLYWGAKLDRPEDLPYGEQLQFDASQEPDKKPFTNQEYPGAGGYFYDEPCLKALYTTGCRDTKLFYKGYAIDREAHQQTLTITMAEEVYPLEVQLCYRIYEGLDVLDRWSVIKNTGTEPVQLESAQSGVLYMPRGEGHRLTHMAGKWVAEYQLERVTLTRCKTVLESRHGTSGPDSCPWFAVDEYGHATEDMGRVWAGSLHWSGNWKISAEVDRMEQTRVTLGMNDYDFGWKLKGGETFTTPMFSCVYSEGGFGGASRRFQQYQMEHLLPQTKAHAIRPVMYNSWGVFMFDINLEQQLKLVDKASEIGIELFIMDDGWFGKRDNDHAGLGDWYPSKTKFPNGLKPLIDYVNAKGMSFGIWVEPEAVNEDSDLYRTHPEWTLHSEGKPIVMWRNQYVLNFAREDVCDYAWSYLEDLLANNNIAYLKWDMNRYLSDAGWPEKPLDEQREMWTRFVYNVHKLFHRIQERFPHVLLENCAGGGSRMDLGMTACSDLVNTSDNTDPLDNLKIFEGYTQLFVPKTSNRMVAPCPDYINGRVTSLTYRLRTYMMSSFGIGTNLMTQSPEDTAVIVDAIAEYKRIREVVQNGTLYRLVSIYDQPFGAYEFAAPDKSRAVVMVLGQSIQFRQPLPRIRLHGLDPEALYRVEGGKPVSGKALMSIGVEVGLRGDFDSKLLHIEKEA